MAAVKIAQLEASVEITVNDPDVIERVTGPEGDEWRSYAYNLYTEEEVLAHLAYNALVNGITRVNQLDGWADLPDDAAVMQLRDDVDCVATYDKASV